MGWKVIIGPSAEADLQDIVTYIARHNSEAAARIGFALIARAESLATFPERGRVVPEFSRPDLRELSYSSYRVIYRIKQEKGCVDIVRFWHAARGLPQIPRSERGRE
jgi:plasmid stabilization system protein ParE